MRYFEFSKEIINKIINELDKASSFIKIAMFQIHNKKIFTKLNEKIKQGVSIEIFTLPYDSINDDIRDTVVKNFEKIINNGAKVYFCKWNIGDPERTTTAVGRWYSFHGKFMVTDKSAIALSANFTQYQELDAILIYTDEKNKIDEFSKKFEWLKKLFITETDDYNGNIRQKIMQSRDPFNLDLFKTPRGIQIGTHDKHWILHYPKEMAPTDVAIEEKLYITPFECRGRDFFMKIIEDAEKYVYISTESFTDKDFPNFLRKVKSKGIDIKILSGFKSMDFSDRIQPLYKQILAAGILFRTTQEDLHAKLLITDKILVVSSINLNRINLGFGKGEGFWRANTETIAVCKDKTVIQDAKKQYINIFNISDEMVDKLAQKVESSISSVFRSIYKIRSTHEVKLLFSKIVIAKQIDTEKFILDIGSLTAKLLKLSNKNTVTKTEFLMALTLHYLTERKHNINDIDEKLIMIAGAKEIKEIINNLMGKNLVKREGDFYKINLETLVKE